MLIPTQYELQRFVAALVIALTTSASLAEIRYSVTDLGTLGGTRSVATGINNHGEVVGSSMTSNGEGHAFSYTPGGSMTDIGSGIAYALNDGGQIVGGYNFDPTGGLSHAFLLNPGGTVQDLGTLGRSSAATAISNTGVIVGDFDGSNNTTGSFVYVANVGMLALGSLDGTTTVALGINDSGTIVGYSSITSGVTHAVTWNGSGGALDLGITDQLDSIAHAINTSGVILGRYDADAADAAPHAFIFTGTLPPLDLGTFGADLSTGQAINDLSDAVGDIQTTNGLHAYVYDATGGHDLNDLVDPSLGWIIGTANGINDAGQIVGGGMNPDGFYHAYILTPIPEPSTVMVFVVGAAILVFRRGRSDRSRAR